MRSPASYDARRALASPPGKARYFALPLVFERCRANHQDSRYAEVADQYFRRGDCLYRLAQSHIVADQRPTGPNRKQRALGLIGIKRYLQESSQLEVGGTALEQSIELRRSAIGVLPSRNEIEGIVIGTKLVTALRHQGHEAFELVRPVVCEDSITLHIEQAIGGHPHRLRAIRPGTEMHAALACIAQVELGKLRLVAACERRFRASLFLQLGERELEMLASPQLICA
ncbi:hypothetical protein ACVWXO_010634 [Bradyrhizobium sp. LM2.7]